LETETKYKVQTKEVIIDFGKPTPEAFDELRNLAQEIEINVLGELSRTLLSLSSFLRFLNHR